jgi:uncharacterized delta-60 repeat protein
VNVGRRGRAVRAGLLLAVFAGLAAGMAPDVPACAGPLRCLPPPPQRAAVAGRIMFGTLGSIARMVPAQAYAVDAAGRPVTAFAQAAGDRLRLVVVRWTAAGAVDTGFGTGDSGAGVAQLFVDGAGTATTGSPRITGTSDGGLLVAVPQRGLAGSRRIELVRLGRSGRLDAAFGAGGVAVIDGIALDAGPRELAGGAIVVAGESIAAAGRVVVLGRDGRPDPAFGEDGTVTLAARPTAVAGAGASLLVGLHTQGAQVRILRLLRTGRPDERAGPGGVQDGAVAGADATTPGALHVEAGGTVTAVGTVARSLAGAPSDAAQTRTLFVAGFAPRGAAGPAAELADGTAAVDAAGRVLVAAADGGRIRRYAADGRLDTTFGRSGIAQTRLPRTVTRSPAVLAGLPEGTVVAGGHGTWGGAPVATFLRLRGDGSRDTSFGPRLLTPRQTTARLGRHDVIALRVHCAADAQRRCVVRLRAGARPVRAFVAPGGDRRVPVRVGATAARRIAARGRAIVRVRFSVIDEAVRVEVLDAPIVVRRGYA